MKRITITHLEAIQDLFGEDTTKRANAVKSVLDGNMMTPWWLISITSGSGYPIFKASEMIRLECLGVLPVVFDDIVPSFLEDKIRYRVLTEDHAKDIIKLLDIIKPDERLIVNCEAGISRSAGVAYFAAEYLGLDPNKEFDLNRYHPNSEIIKLLREAAGFSPLETTE